MKRPLPHAFRSIARSRALVRAAIAIIVCLTLASAIAIWSLRQGAIADTEDDNHRLGVILAEQTTQTLQSVDLVLHHVSDKVRASGVHDLRALHEQFGTREFHDALEKRLIDLPQAEAFTVVDATGHIVSGSREWPAPNYSLAYQDYFRHFAAAPDPDPYISAPGISHSTGAHTIFLARRLSAPDGTFLGVVAGPVLLSFFERFLAGAGLTDGTGITILTNGGTVLVRFPAQGITAGTKISPTVGWHAAVAAGGGHYRSPGAFATVGPSFVSVHPLRLYPIVVDVTRRESAALARWWRQAAAIAIGTLLTTISLTLLLRALSFQIAVIESSQKQIQAQATATQESERRLAEQTVLLRTTLDHMNQGLLMSDANGVVVVYNRRVLEILDLPAEMMAAHPRFDEVVEFQRASGEFAPQENAQLYASIGENVAYERRRPNGAVIEVRTAGLSDGGMVRTYTDITARATVEDMLGHAATHDDLTGLVNRNGFGLRLDAILTVALHGGGGFAVLCLDLDRFKAVNDTLGHAAGDRLLLLAAQRMREVSRHSDVVGRLGGDEFAMILPEANRCGAEQTCERLIESIRMPFDLEGETVRIGVSIGVAIYPDDGVSAEQLLSNADIALYEAKGTGRGSWRNYASENGLWQRRQMLLEREFRAAVELRQFALVYQPICDTVTREAISYEALLRWNHPTRGVVSPGEFIPVAEQTGLIVALGRWVAEAACAEAATWARPLRVAINLSPVQFRQSNLVASIEDVLSRTGLAPDRLDLEVTEGLLLADEERVLRTMQQLRATGARMVLDDFGTANSNLGYLRNFPFDVVKIDRSFLRSLNSDPHALALVEAILTMARSIGVDVIGEGVETEEQLDLLCQLRCQAVQGYLLGRPASGNATRAAIWNAAAGSALGGQAILLPRPVATA